MHLACSPSGPDGQSVSCWQTMVHTCPGPCAGGEAAVRYQGIAVLHGLAGVVEVAPAAGEREQEGEQEGCLEGHALKGLWAGYPSVQRTST